MRSRVFLLFGMVLLISITQCKSSPPEPAKATGTETKPEVKEISSPASPDSGEPNLSTGPDGRTYLSWIETASGKSSMKFSVLGKDMAWSPAVIVAEGERWFVNSADFPSLIALPDGTLAAHWLDDNAPGSEAYNVHVSFSHDGGKTWTKPVIPHHDRSENEHGFVSLIATGPAEIGALWLDGNKIKDEVGDMALMYTTISTDGKIGKEKTLDSRVCECCQTSAVVTPDGIVAVYRDRSEKEIRDISVVRFLKEGWTEPVLLSKDNWQISGCPVNGPSISAAGSNVAVAWFTAPDDAAKVNVSLSSDAGKTFGPAIRVDDGKPLGHVDIIAESSGGALVSWLEQAESGMQVRVRRVQSGAALKNSVVVSGENSPSTSGVPQMTRNANQTVVAWTDRKKPPTVHTAVVDTLN